jgi:hypothetical protein
MRSLAVAGIELMTLAYVLAFWWWLVCWVSVTLTKEDEDV